MCGIAGFYGPGDLAVIKAMAERLRHRGPDGEGYYQDPERPLFLGHRRLAVIDIADGAQPMWDGSGQVGVVFNGEIYNHAQIRSELEARGHVFATDHSDTETLIYGYREWGEGLVDRLNGMFAFCIVDRQRWRLLLARDRMGEKPLYIYEGGDLFAFSSEPHALFAHPQIAQQYDPRGVQKFFAYGYAPGSTTVFRNVGKLLPGEYMLYDLTANKGQRRRYFTFCVEPDDALASRKSDALAEELGALVDEAVGLRLQADVPLGLFLSGGIDSTAVLSAACRHRKPQTIDAFTIGFEEPSFDESTFARSAANYFGCRHHLRMTTLATARSSIHTLFRRLGEPFGDPSILPTAQLAAFSRESVTVALSGDGGDELFAGYDPFLALRPAQIYSAAIPKRLHSLFRKWSLRLPQSDANMSLDYKIRRMLSGLSHPKNIRLPVWMSTIEPAEFREFFANPLDADELYSEAIQVWNDNVTGSDIDRALEFFTRLYLPDDILFKTDRASMMVGLEARAVFLDNKIVDFAARLPSSLKLKGRERKWLLKKAFERRLPPKSVNRKKKGFGIPISSWLRELEPPQPLAGAPINGEAVLRRWQSHRTGCSDERLLLWAWLSLEMSGKID
jgi:asparagine synthase (glutamine-hydrolysing)